MIRAAAGQWTAITQGQLLQILADWLKLDAAVVEHHEPQMRTADLGYRSDTRNRYPACHQLTPKIHFASLITR